MFSDTFKISDFEVFDVISSGIKIPDSSTSKKIEVFGNAGYSKSPISNLQTNTSGESSLAEESNTNLSNLLDIYTNIRILPSFK